MKSNILRLLAVGLLAGPMAANATSMATGSWSTFEDSIPMRRVDFSNPVESVGLVVIQAQSYIFDQVAFFALDVAGNMIGACPGPIDPFKTYGCGTVLSYDYWGGGPPPPSCFDQAGDFTCGGTMEYTLNINVGSPKISTIFWGGRYYDIPVDERSFTFDVPEPATLSLFGLGLAGIGFMRRRNGQGRTT